ncbi:lanthionine synthetase C family protein [Bacteroides acidifaciens]|uniref:lanthionine synthetase C family protein n=1 Tax=Bacteroides acidifaciens TaxID=85831 RepID=UPI00301498FB
MEKNVKLKICNHLASIAESIIYHVKNDIIDYTDNGLLSGNWGINIFLFYYSRLKNDKLTYTIASEFAANLASKINNKYTYCDGLSGIMYALLHLKEEKFIDVEFEPVEKEIIEYLKTKLLIEIKQQHYDFLHGYIGIGLYLVKNRISVEEIVNTLYESAEIDWNRNLFKWKNSMENYNISLSHGISSIILFLVKIVNYGSTDYRCYEMIIGGCNYILSQKVDYGKVGSFFPSYSVSNKSIEDKSRLAWCYGDLGVAYALYKASILLGDDVMQKCALDILQKTTLRKSSIETQINDACICHGTAGLVMFYRRLYLDTKDKIFYDAFNYWLTETLKYSQFQDGIGGYKTKYINEYKNSMSLLMGVSGIGLTFMSCIANDLQKWDEFFLLS